MRGFEKVQRLPPYVLSIVNDLKLEARRAGEDVIDLGFGNPDLPTAPHIVDKLVEVARVPCNHRYSSSRGLPNLRRAIARWYARRYDVELDVESEVITTIGAKEGLGHFVLALISHGDTVLCPDPCYPIHGFSVVIAGGDLQLVPLYPLEDLLDRFEDPPTQEHLNVLAQAEHLRLTGGSLRHGVALRSPLRTTCCVNSEGYATSFFPRDSGQI